MFWLKARMKQRIGYTKWMFCTWLVGIPAVSVVYLTLGASFVTSGRSWQSAEVAAHRNTASSGSDTPTGGPPGILGQRTPPQGDQESPGGATEARPREGGRHVADGTWLKVSDKRRSVYLYNAFYDDRVSLLSDPVIRVLAMVVVHKELAFSPFLFTCHVTCNGRTGVRHGVESSNIVIEMPKRLVYKGETHLFFRYVVTCETGPACDKPERVTLKTRIEDEPIAKIPKLLTSRNSINIEFPDKPNAKGDVALCLPLSFGHIDPYRLIEWIEMHKILGVEKILVYNDSLDMETMRIFDYYSSQGLVEIRQCWTWFDVEPSDRREEIDGRSTHTITDCMYRTMYSYRHLVVADADEIILPTNASNFPELIKSLEQQVHETMPNKRVVNYRFRHAEYVVDPLLGDPDTSQPEVSIFLRYRKRLPAKFNAKNYHLKSIINPLGCVAMHNHICRGYTPGFGVSEAQCAVLVEPESAMDRHYRPALCPVETTTPTACRDALLMTNVTFERDDSFLRFRASLLVRMSHVMGQLGLHS